MTSSHETDDGQYPDGHYDVLVVDAEPGDPGTVRLELVITVGPQKGQILAVSMNGHVDSEVDPALDPLSFLGLPGSLVITNGSPRFKLDE